MLIREKVDFYLDEVSNKTQRGKKSYLTRNLNCAKEELKSLKEWESSGHFLHLGESVYPQIRDWENEIIAIEKVQRMYKFGRFAQKGVKSPDLVVKES